MENGKEVYISLVSPAFNEEATIIEVVRDWMRVLAEWGMVWEIIVVDDGSTDRTAQVLSLADFPKVEVMRLGKNVGYGQAMAAGLAEAKGKYVMTIDSDGQFDLRCSRRLLSMVERGSVDLATGFRVQKKDSAAKVWGDRAMNMIVRALFGLNVTDVNCSQRVMKNTVAKSVPLEATGFPSPTELAVRASCMGFNIAEAPVEHFERKTGESKLKTFRTSRDFALFLLYLRARLWLETLGVLRKRGSGE